MARLKIPGWSDFQHYKERSPPWIKLHKKLLDNYEFHCLPVASRALAPMIWLLASESDGGVIEYASKKIAFRLRMSEADLADALKPLIEAGFVEMEQADSDTLAPCKQDALLETEGETESKTDYTGDFESCWAALPKRAGSNDKKAAYRAWNARLKEGHTAETIIAGAKRYAAWCRATGKEHTEVVKQGATFLGPADPPHFTLEWKSAGGGGTEPAKDLMPLDESLQPYLPKLRQQFDIPTLNSWFASTKLVEKEDWLTLVAPTKFAADHINRTFQSKLRVVFGEHFQVGHGRPTH